MDPLWTSLTAVGLAGAVFLAVRRLHVSRLAAPLHASIPPGHYLSPCVEGDISAELRDHLPSDMPDLARIHGGESFVDERVAAHFDQVMELAHGDADTGAQTVGGKRLGTLSSLVDGIVSGAGTLHSFSQIEWEVVAAMDFSSRLDLSTYGSLQGHVREHMQSIANQDGWYWRLHGYVGEQRVAEMLSDQGREVEFPEAANQEGWDLRVDGDRYQVKVGEDASVIREHLSDHPDINVIATEDMAAHFVDTDPGRVMGLEGLTHDDLYELVSGTAEAIDGLTSFGWSDLPWITTLISGVREGRLLVRRDTTPKDAARNLGIDVGATAAGTAAVAIAAPAIVGGLPVAGAAAATVALGIATVFTARLIGNKVKSRRFNRLREEYEAAVTEAHALVAAAVDREKQSARGKVAKQQAALRSELKTLGQELDTRRDGCRHLIDPTASKLLASFPGVLRRLSQLIDNGRKETAGERRKIGWWARVIWPSKVSVYLSLWLRWYDTRFPRRGTSKAWCRELSLQPTVSTKLAWLASFWRDHPFHDVAFEADVVRTQWSLGEFNAAVDEIVDEGTARARTLQADRKEKLARDLRVIEDRLTTECRSLAEGVAEAARAVEAEAKKLGHRLTGLKERLAGWKEGISNALDKVGR